jgi:uncharacterized membrane protein YdjX (TVP38/TMEM64 family)
MDAQQQTSNSKSKRVISVIFFYGLTIFTIAGFIWSLIAPKDFEATRLWFLEVTSPLGVFAPIAFVVLQAAQVIVTPVSHYAVGMLGGFLYGPYLGGLLNYIGRLIGHLFAFAISRRFGQPLVERYIDRGMIEKFNRYLAGTNLAGFNMQAMLLFLIYFLPLFPDDEISYVVGLTKMKFRVFLACNVLGHLGGAFSLAYLGSGKVSSSDPIFWILLVSTVVGAIGMFVISKFAQKKPLSADTK